MKNKYLLNENTGTLHIAGKCHNAKGTTDYKKFDTEDDAVVYGKRYIKKCRICFQEK